MLPLPSKLLLGLAAGAFAIGFGISVSENDGVVLLVALMLGALIAGLALPGAGVQDVKPVVPKDAPPPEPRAVTPGGAAWGSAWPLAAALALGVVAVGPAVGKDLVLAGAILTAVTAFGWFGRTWGRHAAWTPRVRTRVEDRLLIPAALPIGAFLMALVIAVSVSRILLAVPERASVFVALGVATAIIVAFFVVASRPNARSSGLVALGSLAAVSLVGAGIAGATSGERTFEEKGSEPAALEVAAKGVKFDTDQLVAPAGRRIEIVFRNEDPATYHNVALYKDAGGSSTPVFNGQGVPGVKKITYDVPRPAPGVYRFQCDFHVNMKGEFVVQG
jgi:plastocyanin